MKIKTIYFTVYLLLFSFIGCNLAINEELDYSVFNGEFHFVGYRVDDKWISKIGDFDDIIIFNGTNRAEKKIIIMEQSGSLIEYSNIFEFEINNGKIHSRYLTSDEWYDYFFNNNVLEMKFNYDSDFYSDYYFIFNKM